MYRKLSSLVLLLVLTLGQFEGAVAQVCLTLPAGAGAHAGMPPHHPGCPSGGAAGEQRRDLPSGERHGHDACAAMRSCAASLGLPVHSPVSPTARTVTCSETPFSLPQSGPAAAPANPPPRA